MIGKKAMDRFKKMPIPYTRIRELNVWTLSNFLSFVRILLLPGIFYCLVLKTSTGDHLALGLMILAGLTDVLDGWIARLRGTISSFGKIIDPIADKLFMGGVAVFLIALRGFPAWLFWLMVARDGLIILTSAALIRYYKIVFPSNVWGKLYSTSVALLIASYTLSFERPVMQQLQNLAVVLLFASSLSYAVIVIRYIHTHYRHRRKGRSFRSRIGLPGDRPPDSTQVVDEAESSTSRR